MKTVAGTTVQAADVAELRLGRASMDAVRTTVWLLVLLTISRIHQHFSFLAPFRPALVLAGLAVFAALANRHALRVDHLWKTRPPQFIAGLAVMACISAVFGISLGGAATFILFEYSKVLVLAFLLILAIRNARDLLLFVWGFVIAAGLLSYLSIFVFRMSRPTSDGLTRIMSGYTFDANDIGVVVLIGMALALLTFQASGKTGRLVSTIIIVGIGVTLAKTGSRGAFLGLIATALAILFLVRSLDITKRIGAIVVPAVALLITAPAGYWDQMETMLHPKEDYNWNSQTGRKKLMERGMSYLREYPLTGIGIENFPRAEGTISDRATSWTSSQPGIKWSAPHNSFLQAAAEMGIPGITLFVCLVLSAIVTPIAMRKRIPRHWATGDPEQRFLYLATNYLPVAGVAFAASGFFVSFAYSDPVYILGAFSAGLTTCVSDRVARENRVSGAEQAPTRVQVDRGPEWRSRRFRVGLSHGR